MTPFVVNILKALWLYIFFFLLERLESQLYHKNSCNVFYATHFLKSIFKICILFSLWVLFFNHLYIKKKPHQREEIEERIDAISGCPCPGFSTAFSIRPPSKCRARGWDAPSFCFSPCSSSFLDASSALGGRCQSCLASQCFSSTSVLSSRRSPSNTAGSSVDSSCEKQSTTKFMLNKKTIRGNYEVDGCLCITHI